MTILNRTMCLGVLVGGVVLSLSAAEAGVIRRVMIGGGAGPGTAADWSDAYGSLQTALADAVATDEIWVAAGTFSPGGTQPDTFQLKTGVAIYGGFAGTEQNRNARNWTTHVTILSGDLADDDNLGGGCGGLPLSDCCYTHSYPGCTGCDTSNICMDLPSCCDVGGAWTQECVDAVAQECPNLCAGRNCENSYHVVTGSGTETTAVLDGFTISGGNANGNGGEDANGGGMYNSSGAPTVTNCTFSGNSARLSGGGMYTSSGDPIVTNCTFTGNTANGDYGGGMSNTAGSNPTVTNCAFSGNFALSGGGGLWNEYASNPTLTDCTFTNNTTDDGGGGVGSYDANPSLTNCTFIGNQANLNGEYNGGYGGGLINYFSGSSPPTLTNCVFRGNSALLGGGIHNYGASPTVTNCTFNGNTATAAGGVYNESGSSPTLTNCILWGDSPDEIGNDSSTETVTYSCVEGGYGGDGNISDDPFFIAPPSNLRLSAASPCIDAGDSAAVAGITTDRDGNPRIVDGGGARSFDVDMGAYEFQGGPGPTPIPTVSEWGLIVMTLLLLTAGTVLFGRARIPAVRSTK